MAATLFFTFSLPAAPTSQPARSAFLDQVTANFAKWDADHDGPLSADEIELAVHDPGNVGPAAAAAAALRRGVRADASIEPLTLAKVGGYVAEGRV